MIRKGMMAPGFSLYDTEKRVTTLFDFRDNKNVLLLFFPLAFTSTCTDELCLIRDNFSIYKTQETEVFGISVDSVYTLAAYKEKYNLTYPLLSDFNKVASRDYNILYPSFSSMHLEGVSKRAAFLIDKTGIVQYSEVLENANDTPDFKLIQDVLQFIQ